jgi:hypothetical protein
MTQIADENGKETGKKRGRESGPWLKADQVRQSLCAEVREGKPRRTGAPPLDGEIRRARLIIREKLTPALPEIIERLLASRQPKILIDTLRVLLPYADSKVEPDVAVKLQQQEGLVERTLREIWEQRSRSAPTPTGAESDLPTHG